jgi:hypothetical protein
MNALRLRCLFLAVCGAVASLLLTLASTAPSAQISRAAVVDVQGGQTAGCFLAPNPLKPCVTAKIRCDDTPCNGAWCPEKSFDEIQGANMHPFCGKGSPGWEQCLAQATGNDGFTVCIKQRPCDFTGMFTNCQVIAGQGQVCRSDLKAPAINDPSDTGTPWKPIFPPAPPTGTNKKC